MNDKLPPVGILGGTFNPVHNGHLSIAHAFLESKFIDRLQIILNPAPPHKKEQGLADYTLRFNMLGLAFASFKNVHISNIEQNLPAPAYTVQTLKYLKSRHPGQKYYLCMGKDSLLSFKSWYQWEQILDYCNILAANRATANNRVIDNKILKKTVFVDHKKLEVSSTEIRNKISQGQSVKDLVPLSVWKFIKENKLYKTEKGSRGER